MEIIATSSGVKFIATVPIRPEVATLIAKMDMAVVKVHPDTPIAQWLTGETLTDLYMCEQRGTVADFRVTQHHHRDEVAGSGKLYFGAEYDGATATYWMGLVYDPFGQTVTFVDDALTEFVAH